jgi:hypothetical protein
VSQLAESADVIKRESIAASNAHGTLGAAIKDPGESRLTEKLASKQLRLRFACVRIEMITARGLDPLNIHFQCLDG